MEITSAIDSIVCSCKSPSLIRPHGPPGWGCCPSPSHKRIPTCLVDGVSLDLQTWGGVCEVNLKFKLQPSQDFLSNHFVILFEHLFYLYGGGDVYSFRLQKTSSPAFTMETVIPPRGHGPMTNRYAWDENGEVTQVTRCVPNNNLV
jgi:hypothetical protein